MSLPKKLKTSILDIDQYQPSGIQKNTARSCLQGQKVSTNTVFWNTKSPKITKGDAFYFKPVGGLMDKIRKYC